MSLVTKTLHRKTYPSIDAASPQQSQAGRSILITGGAGTIGGLAARRFIIAGAAHVVITSRSATKAAEFAEELRATSKDGTKVTGYQFELNDVASVNQLWSNLRRDGIEIDTLILNATDLLHGQPGDNIPNLASLYDVFESAVKHQLIMVDHFKAQGPKEGKVLLYVGTNAIHFHDVGLWYTQACSPRIALTRLLQDFARSIPATEMQVLCLHPGFIQTDMNGSKYASDAFPYDDASVAADFYVWASTKHAAFLHGRFVWATWDVDELVAMKAKIEADPGFLLAGVQGIASQNFPMLVEGMQRAV